MTRETKVVSTTATEIPSSSCVGEASEAMEGEEEVAIEREGVG